MYVLYNTHMWRILTFVCDEHTAGHTSNAISAQPLTAENCSSETAASAGVVRLTAITTTTTTKLNKHSAYAALCSDSEHFTLERMHSI